MSTEMTVWVFNGSARRFPNFASAVFSDLSSAEKWIDSHSVSGILTQYPVNTGVYDWAVTKGAFRPRKEQHKTPAFIETFSSASQEHYHYENGQRLN